MAIQADASSSYESVEAGIHNAVLAQVVDCGIVANKFHDANKAGSRPTVRQIVYVFQLETRKSDNTRHLKEFWFNLSANPKSNIAKFLAGWFGRALTDQELQLDHESLIGKPAQLIVGINQKGNSIVTGAVPANQNNVLQLEQYDMNEYQNNVLERSRKMENAQFAPQQTAPPTQYYPSQPVQQPVQPTAPVYQQPAPPMQYQQPMQTAPIGQVPQQYQQPIQTPPVPSQQIPPDDIPF